MGGKQSDLALADFFLFPRLKNSSKGERFADAEMVKQNATKQFKGLSQNEFQKGFIVCYICSINVFKLTPGTV